LLHPEYFSKHFLPSLPSRKTHFKFDPRVLGYPVYPILFFFAAERMMAFQKNKQLSYSTFRLVPAASSFVRGASSGVASETA
jgi:hypothetical protein